MRATNGQIERTYFEEFQKSYWIEFKTQPIYTDKPDVIVDCKGKIGIEITRLFVADGTDKNSEQQQIRFRNKVLDEAKKLYLENGGKKLSAGFGFNLIENDCNLNDLSKKIAKQVTELQSQSGKLLRTLSISIPELSHIYIIPGETDEPRWNANQVYSTNHLNKERLMKLIQQKEIRRKDYQFCDEYWLLIVIDFFDPAQDQEIFRTEINDIYSENFSKIIIFRTAFGQIREIDTINKKFEG